jgi:quinol monooxygenase YgiN
MFQQKTGGLRRARGAHSHSFNNATGIYGSLKGHMDKLAILVLLEAKPGKEQDVEDFLISALPLVQAEVGTTAWYAIKIGPSKFGIFDTFADDAGRNAHLSGDVAKALFAKAEELFAKPPAVEQPTILALTVRGMS